jgi:hypothetical protein
VIVAGANAKLSMYTALPATGADGPAGVADGPAGMFGIDDMPPIPGVVAAGPNVTGGAFADGGVEQPATININSRTPEPQTCTRITKHLHRRRELRLTKR